MKVVKRKNKKTYKGKDGKEHVGYTFFIITDNGKLIAIKNVFDADYVKLDMIAEYVDY